MFLRIVPAILAVFVVLAGASENVELEEDVIVLTDSNFDEVVETHKYLLVEFYAPWCGHCKALAPEYAKAAGKLKADESETKLGKVDATVQQKLAQKYKVQGYPTIKFFKNGVPLEYQGGRTADEIVSWLNKKTGPPSKVLENKEASDKYTEDNDVAVLAFFPNAEAEEFKVFLEVADMIDDVPFAHITDADVATEVGIAENQIAVFKKEEGNCTNCTYNGNGTDYGELERWVIEETWLLMQELCEEFDEGRVDFDGDSKSAEAIRDFIKGNQLPLVSEFTQESAPKIFGGAITTHNLLFVKKSDSNFQTIYDDFKTAAAEFKGQALFIYIDGDNEENGRVMEFFGITVADCPDYRIIKMDEDMAKYKPDSKDLDAESIAAFTRKVLEGQASRHLNSEEIPDDWDKNPVVVLVGKNFREVAFNPKKKVLVEFYAPWCGHCKQLAPIWEKLAEKFKDNEDIIVAKMDSTANEVGEVKVTGFPTLKYFPDDKEENIIDYNGERTFDALVKFLESDGKEVSGAEDDEDVDEEDIDEEDEDQEQEEQESHADKKDEL